MAYIFTNPSDATRTKNKWGMGYYDTDIFPFPQAAGGPFQAFPGVPGLANPPFGSAKIPPVMTCPRPKGMSFFRPNQAIARGLYGLGQDSTDTTAIITNPAFPVAVNMPLLLAGGGALLLAFVLFGKKKVGGFQRRRRTRLRRKYQRRLMELEA